jgi:hypothetical protein
MTLKVYTELVQGSDEWIAARCGVLTASQIGKLLTPGRKLADNDTSRALVATIAAERITKTVEYVHPTFDMQRGSLDEPYARDLYREQFKVDVQEIGFATNKFSGYTLGASPDGLLGSDGGLEIKSPKAKTHFRTIVNGEVPAEHLPQIHACMLVLERNWWDFESYCGDWPIYVQRVKRDKNWVDLIWGALCKFEEDVAASIKVYRDRVGDAPIAPKIDHFAEMEIAP